ncbi:hypothetical protein NDJ06_01295 [Vibrio alginolyticus]|uniref:hypothetical protein n=1 Tax=Vibrio TaxID=662 RepID=UPI001A8D1611|nr:MULTISPECIES: hypothetical protein [Vibrio]MBO0162617.1 hypothetical protein [Vibrio alginolyticus]MCS0183948.1 hypothetical protein [Vibrio alginolyticus]MDW1954944.1 hypothetical protein [Vibrio sp. Vb0562]
MTQNIEERTESAVKKYEDASGVADKLMNTDDLVETGVGARKSLPKVSREADENFQKQKAEHDKDFQSRWSISQQVINWKPSTLISDRLQRFSIGVLGSESYKELLPNAEKLPFTTKLTIEEDLAAGYWLENGVPSKSWTEEKFVKSLENSLGYNARIWPKDRNVQPGDTIPDSTSFLDNLSVTHVMLDNNAFMVKPSRAGLVSEIQRDINNIPISIVINGETCTLVLRSAESPIIDPKAWGIKSAFEGDTTLELQRMLENIPDGATVDFANLPISVTNVFCAKPGVTLMNVNLFRTGNPLGMAWTITGDDVTFMAYQGQIDKSIIDVSCGHILFDKVKKGQIISGKAVGGSRNGPNNKDANMICVSESDDVSIVGFETEGAPYQEQIYLNSSKNCKVLWCKGTGDSLAYSAVATADTLGVNPIGNHQIDFNEFNNYLTSIITVNTKKNLVRWNKLEGSVQEQGVNVGHNSQSADDTKVIGNSIKRVAGDAIFFADSANCKAVDNDVDDAISAYAFGGKSDNCLISHPTATVKNLKGSAIRLSSDQALSLKVRSFSAENIVGHGVEANGKPKSIDLKDFNVKDIDINSLPGGRQLVYVEDGSNLEKLHIDDWSLTKPGGTSASRIVRIASNGRSDLDLKIANGEAIGHNPAAIFLSENGAQPKNRYIKDNKLSNEHPQYSRVFLPGNDLEITVINENQTPYHPPLITFADKDAITRQCYVKSWGAGMFVIASVSTGSDAEIGYECR